MEPLEKCEYIASIDQYVFSGRVHVITVSLREFTCSLCGTFLKSKTKWCNHLRIAAQNSGIDISLRKPVQLTLKKLRQKKRIEKQKSGGKAPRAFDLVTLANELNSEETQAAMLAQLDEVLAQPQPVPAVQSSSRQTKRARVLLPGEEPPARRAKVMVPAPPVLPDQFSLRPSRLIDGDSEDTEWTPPAPPAPSTRLRNRGGGVFICSFDHCDRSFVQKSSRTRHERLLHAG